MEYDEIIIPEAHPKKARQLRYLIGVAALLLAVGLVAPIATLTKFILVENTFSVLSGVLALFREGQFFLFLLIAVFSVVLPILKLGVLYRLVSRSDAMREKTRRLLHWTLATKKVPPCRNHYYPLFRLGLPSSVT